MKAQKGGGGALIFADRSIEIPRQFHLEEKIS